MKSALQEVAVNAVCVSHYTAERDAAIRAALRSGEPIRAVARAAGVSARTVQRIAEREQ